MEAKALTPRDLFDGKVCYEIPPFQRPYVWTEEDQWQPLWDDISRVAHRVLELDDPKASAEIPGHFLGAVVVKQLPSASGDPLRWSVIDGQQRLTTLQVLLDAAQLVVQKTEIDDVAESLQELVLNESKRFRKTPKRFKLWPSRIDCQATSESDPLASRKLTPSHGQSSAALRLLPAGSAFARRPERRFSRSR